MSEERLIIETLFQISDKDGRDCDFILNATQADLDATLSGRDIVPKARQRGVSTYFVARYLAKCLSQRNRRCVIVSHSTEATTRLLDKAHYILKHLKGGVLADMKYESRNELYFNKTDSVFYIGTAGSANIGVGDTITDLHCSEVPLWKDTQSIITGLFNAVSPSGNIAVEATGKGVGNWFHKTCLRAAEGQSRYKIHFYSWTDAQEYRVLLSEAAREKMLAGLDEELEEIELYKKGVLDLEQIAWRRDKLIEMDYDLQSFKEQYPLSLDECFQGRGASYFRMINFEPNVDWRLTTNRLWVLGDHPKVGLHYVAGVDVSGGTGRDNTVLEVFCVELECQVAEWACNHLEPHLAAREIAPILEQFNSAYINVERNNHGILFIKELLENYSLNCIHMSRLSEKDIKEYGRIADYGTLVTSKNRIEVINALRSAMTNKWTIYSSLLKNEMDSFVENNEGRLEAQDGCFDDRVFAGSHALYVVPKMMIRMGQIDKKTEKAFDPFMLDYILDELATKFAADQ